MLCTCQVKTFYVINHNNNNNNNSRGDIKLGGVEQKAKVAVKQVEMGCVFEMGAEPHL